VAAIGRDAEFEGLLVLQGPAQINGRVSGEILSDETVWIGKDAHVEANVTAVNVIVAGSVRGEVRASGRIALESTAKVAGQLTAQRLVLVEGSQLEGSCQAGDRSTADSRQSVEEP
jgi:cytoskeletal protein CcmA (bactofilin family)